MACEQQGLKLEEEDMEQKLLDQCNDRYEKVQNRWENAKVDRLDLAELKHAMREADDKY